MSTRSCSMLSRVIRAQWVRSPAGTEKHPKWPVLLAIRQAGIQILMMNDHKLRIRVGNEVHTIENIPPKTKTRASESNYTRN